MRISDWSSDVCSSDLRDGRQGDSGESPQQWHQRCATASRCDGEGKQCAQPEDNRRGVKHDGWDREPARRRGRDMAGRSEEHTSELQSLMRISYAVFCLKKKKKQLTYRISHIITITIQHKSRVPNST